MMSGEREEKGKTHSHICLVIYSLLISYKMSDNYDLNEINFPEEDGTTSISNSTVEDS